MCPVVPLDPVGILVMSQMVVCQGLDRDAVVGMIDPASLEAAETAVREQVRSAATVPAPVVELEIEGERVRKVERCS